MMRVEPREEDHNINIVTRSGIAIGEDKGKKVEIENGCARLLKRKSDLTSTGLKKLLWRLKIISQKLLHLGVKRNQLGTMKCKMWILHY